MMAAMVMEIKYEARPCIYREERPALLRTFFEGFALVEFEDGTFKTVRPDEDLRMLDSDELFAEYDFTERGAE